MSALSPIDFIIDNFNTEITMDLCGNFAGVLYSMTVSAEAIIQVNLDKVKEAFQFQTDASDVLNSPVTDMKFYWNENAFWDACFNLNAADAEMQPTISSPLILPGPIGTGYDADKSFVCHDFVRFLALGLFNTHHGVDLFDNEYELLNDIRDNARAVWTTMTNELVKYNDVNGDGGGVTGYGVLPKDLNNDSYATSIYTDNVTKKLYEQMIYSSGGKKRFIAGTGMISDSGAKQPLPFQDGDTISLKLIINPEAGQETLTGVSDFGARSYKIKYVLKNTPTKVARDTFENGAFLVRP